MKPRSSQSTEPILLGPISHRIAGVETDPTSYVVEAAFTATAGELPATWHAAVWETIPTPSGADSWWVRVSIGPLSSVGTLAPGDHLAHVRVTVSGTERPELPAGIVTTY